MSAIRFSLLVFTLLFPTIVHAQSSYPTSAELYEANKDQFSGPVEFSGPMAISVIEAISMREVAADPSLPQAPFGRAYRVWERFKRRIGQWDLIYFYDEKGTGSVSAGYALVRGYRVIEMFRTRTSFRPDEDQY